MPELTFIFGPNNTFFFDCPKSWKFHNIPPTLRQLFNASMNPGWRIAQPYCLALGPQINSPEPIWYIGCKVVEGSVKIFYSQTYFDINYPDLSRWMKTIPNAPKVCFITFGLGLSYYASAPGYGSIWAGIPTDLTDKIQKAFDTPCCVSLGMNNAWFVMWPDGYFSWKFYGAYGTLDKILDTAEPRSVSYLAISPYNKHHYFVAFKDRTVKYNLSPEWIPQMQEVFREWQAEILQKQGYQQPYRHSIAGPSPPQQQWNPNYPPTPGTPGYSPPSIPEMPGSPLSPYSNPVTPPFSPYSPYGDFPQNQYPMEMNRTILATHPAIPRSSSTDKKKFLLKRLSQSAAPVAVIGSVAARTASTAANEGSQTCGVM